MTQLVELQERADELDAHGRRVRLVALVEVDKEGTEGRDVAPRTGFAGRVLLDLDERVRAQFELPHGSVVLIDPQRRQRWRKPGSAFKRPRADLVVGSVTAILAREADPGAVEPLVAALAEGTSGSRAAAATRLGELEAREAREPLERLAADAGAPERARERAFAALARLRDARSLDVAARVAGDPAAARDVRTAAATFLLGFGDDFDPPAGTEWRPRWSSAESRDLTERQESLVPCARALVGSDTADLRRLGTALLARLRHANAFEDLLELSDDRDATVREHALTGLCEWRTDARVQAVAEERKRDRATDVKRVARYLLDGPVGKLRE